MQTPRRVRDMCDRPTKLEAVFVQLQKFRKQDLQFSQPSTGRRHTFLTTYYHNVYNVVCKIIIITPPLYPEEGPPKQITCSDAVQSS